MDLLGGYGSGSESGDDDSAPTEPVPAFKPSIAVSAAPPTTSSLYDDQPRAAVSAPQPSKAAEVEDEEQERPRLVAPAVSACIVLPGALWPCALSISLCYITRHGGRAGASQSRPARGQHGPARPSCATTRRHPRFPACTHPQGPVLADEDTDYGPGPARPPVTAFSDEKEIPSVSNPEVWSKLPAPKAPAARRVIQMRLALHKSLLTKEAQDRDDEDELEAAKARKRARQGGANGKPALLDLLPKPKTALAGSSGGGAAFGAGGGMIDIGDAFKKPAPRPARAAAAAFGGADSDDEDPMARLGPMPEAGAYAAGPIADDGEPLDDVPTGAADESQAAAAPQAAAAAMYYVGDDGGGAGGAGPSSAGYAYGAEQYAVAGASGGDAGQELFQQALFAEQQRAAKRGEVGVRVHSHACVLYAPNPCMRPYAPLHTDTCSLYLQIPNTCENAYSQWIHALHTVARILC